MEMKYKYFFLQIFDYYMKIVFRTLFFHIICILFFAITYFFLKDHYHHNFKERLEFIDYILLSTTIQAGVGISDIYPNTIYAKLAIIFQQMLMICTHVVTIYLFNL
jgi:hypothetical protein